MRALALHLGRHDGIIQRKRLFMPCKGNNIPTDWLKALKNQSSGAEFLSIHTGQVVPYTCFLSLSLPKHTLSILVQFPILSNLLMYSLSIFISILY
jgi:hypothetical protein